MCISQQQNNLSRPRLSRRIFELLAYSPTNFSRYAPIKINETNQLVDILKNSELRNGDFIEVEVTKPLAYVKTVELPRSARKKAKQVLEVQAAAFEKSSQTDILHQSTRLNTIEGKDQFLQVFARRSDVDKIYDIVEAEGLNVRSIFFRSEKTIVELDDHARDGQHASLVWWAVLLLAMNAWVSVEAFQSLTTKQSVNDRISEAYSRRSSIQEIINAESAVSEAFAEKIDAVELQVRRLENDLLSGPILAKVTDLFPKDTWLSRYEHHGDFLYVSGRTIGDPLLMIETLESAPWITEVAIESPLQLDDYSSETIFDLRINLDRSAV